MKIAAALCLLSTAAAISLNITYDPGYDNGNRSLTAVSCSNGDNGLITRYGWQAQGDIPPFPYIGGSEVITGWNSAQCGQCFCITYNGQQTFVLTIDHAASGMNIGREAMEVLTKNQAESLGTVQADVVQVGVVNCGLTPTTKRSTEFKA